MEASKTTRSFRRNDEELRKDIVKNTSMHEERPQTQAVRNMPPLLPQGYKPLLHEDNSSLTTQRNMKFHLDQLEDKLQELMSEVRGTREECRELIERCTFLKNSLVYSELYGLKGQLDGKLAGLSNQIRQGKEVAAERYREVRNDCGSLWQSTQELREHVFQLQMRVEKMQLKMGYKDSYRLQNVL